MSETIMNSCGFEVFRVSDSDRIRRFLSLGSENGTYYISSQKLTKECINSVIKLLKEDRNTLLNIIQDYIKNNKSKKQEPLLFALAWCCSYNIQSKDKADCEFRKKAYSLIKTACYTPTGLFMFINFCKTICQSEYNSTGWNNVHKRAIADWYLSKEPNDLVYMMTKYQDRHGYNHRDVLRLCHIIPANNDYRTIFRYFAKGYEGIVENEIENNNNVNDFLDDFERLKLPLDEDAITELIKKWKFSREHIPTKWLNSKYVWKALINHMPDQALLRNLNKITLVGALDDSDGVKKNIIDKISKVSKIHPMHLLISLKMYASGSGHKGGNSWIPDQDIVDALNDRFYSIFTDSVFTENNKIKKRVCIALDVSGSMFYTKTNGTECMNAAEVGCALSMIMKSLNPEHTEIMGFSSVFTPLLISHNKRLDDNLKVINELPFLSTDISLPFIWAKEHKKQFDAFIVITDNETNCNKIPPIEALNDYRKATNNPCCKLIVVALAANEFSVADPTDKYMLDVAGFDASVPDVITEFIESE